MCHGAFLLCAVILVASYLICCWASHTVRIRNGPVTHVCACVQVPCVSAWEWHPYSVAGADECGFFLMIKAGGDWERRMCLAVERRAATFGTA